jgi:hypothetical protein
MSGAKPRASCRGLFRKLYILPVPCQYILSVMIFIIDKPNNFQADLEIPGVRTKSKKNIFVQTANLTSFRKKIIFSGITIYISLQNSNLNHQNDRKKI